MITPNIFRESHMLWSTFGTSTLTMYPPFSCVCLILLFLLRPEFQNCILQLFFFLTFSLAALTLLKVEVVIHLLLKQNFVLQSLSSPLEWYVWFHQLLLLYYCSYNIFVFIIASYLIIRFTWWIFNKLNIWIGDLSLRLPIHIVYRGNDFLLIFFILASLMVSLVRTEFFIHTFTSCWNMASRSEQSGLHDMLYSFKPDQDKVGLPSGLLISIATMFSAWL